MQRLKTDFDKSIGKINIIPQEIGRVILNLINNAFYAVNERQKMEGESMSHSYNINSFHSFSRTSRGSECSN